MAMAITLLETPTSNLRVSGHLLCTGVHAFVVKSLHVELEENLSLPNFS